MAEAGGKGIWLSFAGLAAVVVVQTAAVAFFLGDMRSDVDNAVGVLNERSGRFQQAEARLNAVENVLSASGVHLQNIRTTLDEIKAVLVENGNTLSVLVARENAREGAPLPTRRPQGQPVPRAPGRLLP